MKKSTVDNNGYKRLNIEKLNFSNADSRNEDCMEEVIPIRWTKEVISGEKKVKIQK